MIWFLLTLSCIILWGITDILLKKSLDYSDSLSQYKTFVWIGIVMAPAGIIMALCSETLLDSIMMVKDNLYLIPLAVFYAAASLFGLLGKKHLDASVVSPLENIDGAMAAIILYFFFLLALDAYGYIAIIEASVRVCDLPSSVLAIIAEAVIIEFYI